MNKVLLILAACSCLVAPEASAQRLLATIPIAGRPGHLAVNTTTNMIYVPNETLNTLEVIDGSSNHLLTSIPLGGVPFAAAVDSSTNIIYVTIPDSSVVVIDGATNAVTTVIPATVPYSIAVNPLTNLIYFSMSSSGNDGVGVIDGVTNEIVATITLGPSCCAGSLAVNTSTNRVYVDDAYTRELAVIDGNTNQYTILNIAGLCGVGYVAVDSTLNRIYATGDACSGLYVINAATEKLVAVVLLGYFGPIAVNPVNHQVADFSLSVLSFINGRTGAVVGGNVNFPVSQEAQSIVVDGHNRYYVSLYSGSGSSVGVVAGPTP